jgi:hypothetical protein
MRLHKHLWELARRSCQRVVRVSGAMIAGALLGGIGGSLYGLLCGLIGLLCGALLGSGHAATGLILAWMSRFGLAGAVGGALAAGFYKWLDTKPAARSPSHPDQGVILPGPPSAPLTAGSASDRTAGDELWREPVAWPLTPSSASNSRAHRS